MALSLESILKIQAQISGAEGIARLRQGITDLGRAGKAAEGGMKGLGGAVAGLSGVMGALTPLLSIGGIMALGAKALETGDKFNDLAQKTGISVEALAKFSKAAALNGTDVDGVAKALQKLSKGMMEAASTGTGPAAGAFKMLGINVTDASGRLRGADQVMLEIADRFQRMPDGATKTALAMQMLGKSGAEMIPMLNQGGEAIEKLGVKMSSDFARKADEFHDKTTMLGGAVNGLGIVVADVLLPTLINVADQMIGFAKQVVDYIEKNKSGLETVMNWITAFGTATYALINQTLKAVAVQARFLGRLLAGDFLGAIGEVKDGFGDFFNQAGQDFRQLGAILNGTATSTKAAGGAAAGALSAADNELLKIQNEQEAAKQKQAQWVAWVNDTELSYKRLQFAISQAQQKASGDLKIMDARVGAEVAINNAAKTTFQIKLSTAKTDAERLGLTRQIAEIDINTAKLQLDLAKAQAAATVQEAAYAIEKAKTGQMQALATLAEAQARGVVTTQYEKALEAQVELVQQTIQEYNVAKAVAAQKGRAADATYAAAVAQAQASVSAMQMQIQQNAIQAASQQAANNIRQMPSSLDSAAQSANRLAGSLERGANATGRMAMGLFGMQPTTLGGSRAADYSARGYTFDPKTGQYKYTGRSYAPSLPRFASGAYVQGPTVAQIGEGGESEYVIPASKMASASSSYLAGARGTAVLSSTGTTTAAAPQINVTTGPVLQFNGERYVKLDDLERAMRATADGVISRLRTPAARIALGLR